MEGGRSKITDTFIYDNRTTAIDIIIATEAQTIYPYTFTVGSTADIRVERRGTPLVPTTDYTVTPSGAGGGDIEILTGSQSAGDEIRIIGPLDSLSTTVAATNLQTVFNYSFDPTDLSNLRVVKNGDLLVLTTDYTVVANAGVGGVVTLVSGATTGDKVRITVEAQNYGLLTTGGLHQLVGCGIVGNMQSHNKIYNPGDIDITSTTLGISPMGGQFDIALNQNTTVIENDNVTSASRIVLVRRFFETPTEERGVYVSNVVPGVSFTVSHSSGVELPFNYIII